MILAGPLLWLVVGAALLELVTLVTIPPLTWLTLTLFCTRLGPCLRIGLPSLWLALYAALAIGDRAVIPVVRPCLFRDRGCGDFNDAGPVCGRPLHATEVRWRRRDTDFSRGMGRH